MCDESLHNDMLLMCDESLHNDMLLMCDESLHNDMHAQNINFIRKPNYPGF